MYTIYQHVDYEGSSIGRQLYDCMSTAQAVADMLTKRLPSYCTDTHYEVVEVLMPNPLKTLEDCVNDFAK